MRIQAEFGQIAFQLGMAMRHFFPMRIDAHIRILAHIGHIRAYMREYLLLAHFAAPAWPSLVAIQSPCCDTVVLESPKVAWRTSTSSWVRKELLIRSL